jgi:hypothetical protein
MLSTAISFGAAGISARPPRQTRGLNKTFACGTPDLTLLRSRVLYSGRLARTRPNTFEDRQAKDGATRICGRVGRRHVY